MEKVLFSILSLFLVIGLVSAAPGSFGEVASGNACHCLIFNSTSKVNVWTLYSSFNTSIQFSIIKPNLANTTITTSVTNGTIQPDSYYPINVIVISNSSLNQSGYLAAYVVSNATTPGGASIRLGTDKLIKVEGSKTVPVNISAAPLQSSNPVKSTTVLPTPTTSIQSSVQTENATNIQSQANAPKSVQSSTYLYLGVIVVLLVVISALTYSMSAKGKKRSTKPKQPKPKRKNNRRG